MPAQCFDLLGDFVGGDKIIRIQPLDVISLAKLEGLISRCGSALVFVINDRDRLWKQTAVPLEAFDRESRRRQ